MRKIQIEIAGSQLDIGAAWEALIARAPANVFLDPCALNAVFESGFAALLVFLAWDSAATPAKLVGVWALQRRKLTPFGPSYLAAPGYDYAFASAPVVDPAYTHDVVPAFLDAIAADPALPDLIRVKYLDGEVEASSILLAELKRRGRNHRLLSERNRAYASRQAAAKLSGSTRKKLRQDWNRLSATGAIDIVNDRENTAGAIEAFLALEAASWKGTRGTALLNTPADAAFARKFLTDLAREQKASVALLRVDGKPIAAQVLLYCGDMAYTWKTAYDDAFARYSPGALLVDKITEELIASGVAAIESCSPEGGFLEGLWTGRRKTIDVLADVGGDSAFGFTLAELAEAVRTRAKEFRSRVRSAMKSRPKPKPPGPAVKVS